MDGTYESIYLVAFILAGPVYNNALKNRAELLCRACEDFPACVAEHYLTLRTGCEKHGRKNPLPFPFSQRSHIGNLRQVRKQGKGRSSKRKGNRRCPFLFAPAAGAATLPPSADGESPAEVQWKTSRPLGANAPAAVRAPRLFGAGKKSRPIRANTLTQFAHPGFPVQKRSRPVRANAPAAVRVPRSAGAEKEPPRQGEHANAVRVPRSAGAGKRGGRKI